jgi:FAD-dependent oxidoreductase domain-containing protein 1
MTLPLEMAVRMQIPVEPMRRHEHYIETSADVDHLPFVKDVRGLAVHAYRQRISVGLVDFDHPDGEDFTIDSTDYPDRVRPALLERFSGLGKLTLRDSWTGLDDQNRFDGNMIIGNWPGHAELLRRLRILRALGSCTRWRRPRTHRAGSAR